MQLFSYPIEELNKMFIEEPFLKYIGENQLAYYFGPEHRKIQEKNIIDEESEEENKNDRRKKGENYVPASEVFCRVETTNEKPKPFNKNDPSIFSKKSSNERKKKGVSESSLLTI
jgi:hypothetical protein